MKNTLLAPDIRDLISANKTQDILEFCESTHPAMVAEALSGLTPKEIWEILSRVKPDIRALIFSEFDVDIQIEMANTLNRRAFASLITDMPPDDRVDLLKSIPEDQREALLPAIAQAEREDIRRLSSYAEGTAGAVMTSDYAILSEKSTAKEAIDQLRREAPDKETIYYAYVVDEGRKLIGLISLKDLILSPPSARIGDIMNREVISVRTTDDQEEAALKIQKYDLLALPVINGNDNLVGIITYDDAIDIFSEEHTEDLEKLMAIRGAHEARAYMRTSAWKHFKNRSVWVLLLAFLGLVSGYIVHNYSDLLLQVALLATFMPMLADTGGNTGSQSAALVIRALAVNEITPKDFFLVLFKEMKVAILLGLMLAVFVYARVMLFTHTSGSPAGYSVVTLGIAISAALCFQVFTATLIGATLPMIAAKLNKDPAVVASPFLTTTVDITGLLIFFSTAKYVLGF
jgi:magnesium transporter